MSDELQRSVGRLEGKLDSLIDMLKEANDNNKERDNRISHLEKWRTMIATTVAVFAAVFTAFGVTIKSAIAALTGH